MNPDVLILLALKLDLSSLNSLCRTSKRMNRILCDNEIFWLNKIKKDYPNITELNLYGSNYKQIYKNLTYPPTIELVFSFLDEETFSFPVKLNIELMKDIGKFILYVISETDNQTEKSFEITIYNQTSVKCVLEVWKITECLKYINYDTKKVKIDINTEIDLDIEHSLKNFDEIVTFVKDNWGLDLNQWPILWI